MVDFKQELIESKSVSQIFKLVKDATWRSMHQSRSGLELGLVSLENRGSRFIGAFHPVDSNIIIVNQEPLERIAHLDLEVYNSYIFHILLHEYLRSMGYKMESRKKFTLGISQDAFGENHIVTKMAEDAKTFFPDLMYPTSAPNVSLRPKIVKDFDKIATSYIE